ncbi:MAG: thioredoxin family protein [Kaistella sp.]|nr:thioredoxin family protein [Kaistella sp.]
MRKILITLALFASVVMLTEAQSIKPGEKAPAFSLKGVDGKTVSLSDYNKEKGVILIFSCNTCPYVVAYEDRIIELHNNFAPKGFPVVAINSNNPELSKGDSFEEMKKKARDKSFTFPYLFDEKQDIFPKYGATRTPEVFLLKNTGNGFEVVYTGTIDDNYKSAGEAKEKYVENAVKAVLKGISPEIPVTKAIGCGIKVKK